MPKKGLTEEKTTEREKFAFEMFRKDPDLGAKEVRAILKRKLKFGMRLARLYQIKRMAKDGEYMPKKGKERGAPASVVPMRPQQAARRGERVNAPPQHPAVAAAYKMLEDAGFKNITIDAYIPVHVSHPVASNN